MCRGQHAEGEEAVEQDGEGGVGVGWGVGGTFSWAKWTRGYGGRGSGTGHVVTGGGGKGAGGRTDSDASRIAEEVLLDHVLFYSDSHLLESSFYPGSRMGVFVYLPRG